MNRIFVILLVVVLIVVGFVWYRGWSRNHAVNSGTVTERNGQPVKALPERSDTPGEENTANQPMAPQNENTAQQGQDQASVQPATQPQPTVAATDGQAGPMAPPASDSIARNPPNGMIFAGTGKYQLYRQGDITWRLNTDSGQACIIFATDAQWRLAKVYQHGCGRT